MFKLNYCVDTVERYAMEGRGRGQTVDDKMCCVIDLDIVVFDQILKQQSDIEIIGALRATVVCLI